MIVENKNGVYRALISALADLSAEGPSPDEAVQRVRHAVEAYLATVELKTIKLEASALRAEGHTTAEDWLAAVKVFEGDEKALREHFARIGSRRQRQRESVN